DLNVYFKEYEQLGAIVEKEVYSHMWTSTFEAVSRGQTVTFGKFAVNTTEIRYGKKLLPWDQVTAITESQEQGGWLVVAKPGIFSLWARVKISRIPNYRVFYAVIHHLWRNQKG